MYLFILLDFYAFFLDLRRARDLDAQREAVLRNLIVQPPVNPVEPPQGLDADAAVAGAIQMIDGVREVVIFN